MNLSPSWNYLVLFLSSTKCDLESLNILVKQKHDQFHLIVIHSVQLAIITNGDPINEN